MRTLAGLLLLASVGVAGDIGRDIRLPAGERTIEAPLRIIADNVTLDLGDAVLIGPNADHNPDGYTGIGIVVEGRKKVTIRGGRLRGFNCAILIKDCEEVVLENVDVSGNFRQRLRSTPEKEDGGDWLRPHENDQQEWRKNYGAGICLENCKKCVVRACKGRKQQNGLILDRCTGCKVYDNDFSFNSGWGIALWRSSENVISRNSCDWCVRGYSHGVYDRGQDSAGILVFEQCHNNVFVHNSATHSGDGFFLFAGNETLKKTGTGGCNDNIVLRNDFSHAVANAIEATFSGGNRFIENRCDDSNYGVWAGYSYETAIEANVIRDNTYAGVAIEHGTANRIVGNKFARNPKGIRLWWDNDKDLLASKFGQTHSCNSAGYIIAYNRFRGDEVGIHVYRTTKVAEHDNVFTDVKERVNRPADVGKIPRGMQVKFEGPPPVDSPGKRDTVLPKDWPRGRKHIMVDEWGPLDPTEVAVFPRRVVAWEACTFHVLGATEYTVAGLPAGLTVEKGPRTFRVKGGADGIHEFTCTVKVGERSFDVEGVLLRAMWRVRHWSWTKDPRENNDWRKGEPLFDKKLSGLDSSWQNRAPAEGVPADRFATIAETSMELPAGLYEVRTVSDDGVRVYIDGKKVQEDWTWHAPREKSTIVELAAGSHKIVVEHFEIDGYAALSLMLEKHPIEYDGKYKGDARLVGRMTHLTYARRWARRVLALRLGRDVPAFRVRLEDAGRDASGTMAEVVMLDGEPVVVVKSEYVFLRALNPHQTLLHEFFHCLHRQALGEKYERVPPWVREGAALYIAGKSVERMRFLTEFVRGDPSIKDPLARLVDGLDGEHGFLDYYEDFAAFEAVDLRHGRERTLELILKLFEEPDIALAVRAVLDEDMETFKENARDHARCRLENIEEGRDRILAVRRHLDAGEPQKALDVLEPKGADTPLAAYYEALALERLGHHAVALRGVQAALMQPHAMTMLGDALRLELRLLKATGSAEYEAAAARAELDLTVFGGR